MPVKALPRRSCFHRRFDLLPANIPNSLLLNELRKYLVFFIAPFCVVSLWHDLMNLIGCEIRLRFERILHKKQQTAKFIYPHSIYTKN